MQYVYRLILGLAAIAACWGAWYVVYRDSLARIVPQEARPEVKLAVEVVPVRAGMVAERIELVGSLAARAEVAVRSRVSGYVKSLPVDVGDVVDSGQDILLLDDQTQREIIANAEAALRVAQAQLQAQQANHEQAQRNVERQQGLIRDGAGPQQALEESRAALAIASAQIAVEQARVEAAASLVQQQKLALEELQLKSPLSGVVAERYLDVGDLAQPQSAVLRIVDLSTIETIVHVVEKDYDKLRPGQTANVSVDAWPDREFPGVITRIAPVVDPETRTAAVHVEIPNSDGSLKPGMHARVGIVFASHRGAGVVPIDALVNFQGRWSVYVTAGNPPLIEEREVRRGISDGHVTEILEGVEVGDQVVTLGNRLVRPGQEVEVHQVPWPVTLDIAYDADPPGAADVASTDEGNADQTEDPDTEVAAELETERAWPTGS